MNRKCPECRQDFEREPAFFLGAMAAAYFIGSFSLVPTMVICLFILKMELAGAIAIGVAQILILHPLLFRYSRLVWIHVENRMTRSLENT